MEAATDANLEKVERVQDTAEADAQAESQKIAAAQRAASTRMNSIQASTQTMSRRALALTLTIQEEDTGTTASKVWLTN